MMLHRRNVLMSSAAVPAVIVGMTAGQLATCGPNGIVLNPAIVDAIEQAVAKVCNFIPAFSSIIALVGAKFPVLSGATTIADTVLNEISALFCSAVPTPPLAGGKFGATTIAGTQVQAHGWIVGPDGKLVYV